MIRYQVRLFDQTGTQVAVFDDTGGFRSFTFHRRLDDVGPYVLAINGEDARTQLFELDSQAKFYRQVISEITSAVLKDWYAEFEGLHRSPSLLIGSDGKSEYNSHGFDYNEFLDRRDVLYKAGHARATKNDPAETAMKEFVDENLGPNALVSGGRISDGVMTGLTIESDAASGSTWTGSRSYKRLLKVLQEIAVDSGLHFRIVGNGVAAFKFETFKGADRSTIGLDRSTGLNGAGNVPVIFKIETGTMRDVAYSKNRSDERNAIFIAGQGQGEIREVQPFKDSVAIADSPWNLREKVMNATGEGLVGGYSSQGSTLLTQLGAKETVNFKVVQKEGQRYGIDYFLGDKMTAEFDDLGVDSHLLLVGVTVAFRDGIEDLNHEFAPI